MLIIAHRGASGLVGEDNTLCAFERAIDLGADFIELDIRKTKDEVLVCFHDPGIGGESLSTLSHEELIARVKTKVPTLREAIALCRGRIGMLMELKEGGYEQQILDLIEEQKVTSPIQLQSFSENTVRACAQQDRWPVGLLLGAPPNDGSLDGRDLAQQLASLGARFVAVGYSEGALQCFKADALKNYSKYLWTVNDPGSMRIMQEQRLEGVITDRPELALAMAGRPPRKVTSEWIKQRIARAEKDASGKIDALTHLAVEDRYVRTEHVRIGRGVLDEVADWATALWGKDARVGLVMDEKTRSACGERVEQSVQPAASLVLEPASGWAKLTPHVEFCERIQRDTSDCDALIAMGSGTVNDLVKYAAHQTQKPYAVVATAASMNGYTSSIAALLVDDLKRTLPCAPPVLVLADVQVLAEAPHDLTRAGYADLLSKNVATADWKLGSILADETFSGLPWEVTNAAIERCVEAAGGLANRDPEAVEILMQALILSGFAMSLAGSSSPASGGEHLISHLWDMQAYSRNEVPLLHGLQVGLGTQLTARLYDCLRKADPATFKACTVTEEQLAKAHGPLWPVCKEQALVFLRDPEKRKARVDEIGNAWPELWKHLDPFLIPAEDVRARLSAAGIPTRPAEYGIKKEDVRFALLHAADIRARYTVLHLAREIGLLEELADEVLSFFD